MPTLPTQIDELGSVTDGQDDVLAADMNDLRRYVELLSRATQWSPPESGEPTTGLFNQYRASAGYVGANVLRAVPCILPRPGVYGSIAAYVGNSVGGTPKACYGIYDDDNGNPGSLIYDAGEFQPDTQDFYERPITPNLSLPPGRYWLALIADTSINWGRAAIDTCFAVTMKQGATGYDSVWHVYRATAYDVMSNLDPFGAPARDSAQYPPQIVLIGA